jgi:hypothetical protein
MIIFSASILLTIAQIVQAVLTFRSPGVATLAAGLTEVRHSRISFNVPLIGLRFQGFIAVTVASFSVVATGIRHFFLNKFVSDNEGEGRAAFRLSDAIEFRTGDEESKTHDASSSEIPPEFATESTKQIGIPSKEPTRQSRALGPDFPTSSGTKGFVGRLRSVDPDIDVERK